MSHRSIGSIRRQRISAVVFAVALMLVMAMPAVAAPARPDPHYTDFGDLPATYPTNLADDGPRHSLSPSSNLWLGACVDGEANGQPTNVLATGDNIVSSLPLYGTCGAAGDEDGVTRVAGKGGAGWTNGTVASGNGGAVEVTIAAGQACLGAFFDFARDWSLPLAILRDVNGNVVTQPLAPGTHTLYFDVPAGTFDGNASLPLYGRFRVTSPVNGSCASSTAFSPTGLAPDGEVEDYRWSFGPNAVSLTELQATTISTGDRLMAMLRSWLQR